MENAEAGGDSSHEKKRFVNNLTDWKHTLNPETGVGSQLYQVLETTAAGLGIARIFAEVSITARPFFERRDFNVIEEQAVIRRGLSMTNFRMEKRLVRL